MSTPQKREGDERRRQEEFEVNASDSEERKPLLGWYVVKGAPGKVNWDRLDVLDYAGWRRFFNLMRFGALPVNGRGLRTTCKGNVPVTAHEAYNQLELHRGPLSLL